MPCVEALSLLLPQFQVTGIFGRMEKNVAVSRQNSFISRYLVFKTYINLMDRKDLKPIIILHIEGNNASPQQYHFIYLNSLSGSKLTFCHFDVYVPCLNSNNS